MKIQVLHGLGGVGKTRLAVEYAYKHAENYSTVWWVRAEKSAALAADLISLAKTLRLPEINYNNQETIVKAALSWLENKKNWLLVFDNAEDPESIARYLPQNGTDGNILITSRNPMWGDYATPLQIPVMQRPESVELLGKWTGQQDETASGKNDRTGIF